MAIEYSQLEKRNEDEALKRLHTLQQKEKIEEEIKKVIGVDKLLVVRWIVSLVGAMLTIGSAIAVYQEYVSPTSPLPTTEIAALIGGLVVLSFGISLKRKEQ